jgi:hypothetical protein
VSEILYHPSTIGLYVRVDELRSRRYSYAPR